MTAYPDTAPVKERLANGMAGPAVFALAAAAAVGVFWFGLVSLGEAWSTPEYSHGPVIPMLSLYMFLREMKHVPPVPGHMVQDRWPGVAIVIAALALGIFGNLVRIPDIVTYAMIFWIWGLVLAVFGLRRGWPLWPGVLHLIFMLPLPQMVYWPLSVFLQGVSSEIGVGLIALVGIPVFLDGNVIDLGIYKLQVAEACSGLRYLFPILSFSYVFGVLYNGPRWHKVVLLLAAAPVTVLMNSFRIGVIGILVDNFGIEQAEGFLHLFEGWIIFIACVAILFALAILMQQTTRNPQPIADTLDIDFGSIVPEAKRVTDITPSRALIAVALATLAVAVVSHAAPQGTRVVPDRAPLVLFPGEIEGRDGTWRGSLPLRLEPQIEATLGADDYLSVRYDQAAAAQSIDLFIAFYNRQTEGSGLHSPEVCLPTGGWEVSAWAETTLDTASGSVTANRAVIQKGLARQLVVFWFEQRGRHMTGSYAAKAVTMWDSITHGRTDGGLVRLVTPIGPNESVEAAEARLGGFLEGVLPVLPRFMPPLEEKEGG